MLHVNKKALEITLFYFILEAGKPDQVLEGMVCDHTGSSLRDSLQGPPCRCSLLGYQTLGVHSE